MKEKILGWNLAEIVDLFNFIDNNGGSKSSAFSEFALKFNKSAGSVRNFYYKFLSLIKKDNRVRKLGEENGIDFEKLNSQLNNKTILMKLTDSEDIKKSDLKNKFYGAKSLAKKDINLGRQEDNVVMLKEEITNEDIESLFWGLVRLVKHRSETEIDNKIRKELEFKDTELETYKLMLKKKEVLLKELKLQNENLRSRLTELNTQNETNTKMLQENLSTINSCLNSNNMVKLRSFLSEIGAQTNLKEN